MTYPKIDRAEIDRLATEWCKSKHIVVIMDDVSRQFAADVANLVLKNFVDECKAKAEAAAKAKLKASNAIVPEEPKSKSLVTLT